MGDVVEQLPWEWFDFAELARAVTGKFAGVEEGGATCVYAMEFEGRSIPFKYFRREGAAGQARRTLVLLHGMGLNIASFRGVSGYLFATHDLLLVDYSGLMCAGE